MLATRHRRARLMDGRPSVESWEPASSLPHLPEPHTSVIGVGSRAVTFQFSGLILRLPPSAKALGKSRYLPAGERPELQQGGICTYFVVLL